MPAAQDAWALEACAVAEPASDTSLPRTAGRTRGRVGRIALVERPVKQDRDEAPGRGAQQGECGGLSASPAGRDGGRQTGMQAGRPAGRQVGRQAGRQADSRKAAIRR